VRCVWLRKDRNRMAETIGSGVRLRPRVSAVRGALVSQAVFATRP